MTALLRDARFALRHLFKSPWFTMAAVSMLALGICANGTVFSWINATLLHPIPGARNTGELVTVMRGAWNTSPSPPLSYPDYRDLRERNHSFSGILAYHADWVTLTGGDTPKRVYAVNASANYFDVLGIKPYLGRFFRPDEEASEGGSPYLVIGYSLWQTRFGADPGIIGRSVEINQHALTVIGVAPEGFVGCMTGIRSDAWVPLLPIRQEGFNWQIQGRDRPWLNVTGRLRPGVSRARATEDLEVLMRQLVAQYPGDHQGVNTIYLDPLWRSPFGANIYLAPSLPILLAIAGVVLLLTCANVATLMLVRFVARRREIAIRQSLGANRIQLMRQMILEGMFLSLGGGVLAVLLTEWSSKTMARFIPPSSSPIAINGYLDWHVVAAIMVLAFLASILCGAMPAWRSSHVAPAEVLKDEAGSVSSGRSNQFLLSGLVVAQIALSLTLMVTAGLFMRTLRNTNEGDAGFDRSHVLLASVDLQSANYSWGGGKTLERSVIAKLQALPGVESVAVSDWVPLSLTRGSVNAFPEGYVPKPHESTEVRNASVSPDYFQTMKIPLLQGRAFTAQDREDTPKVAIVDETMANHFWPGQIAVGKRMQLYGQMFTVVGIAKNSKHQSMNESPESIVYLSYFQFSGPQTIFHMRTKGDPQLLAPRVEEAVHELDSKLPVFDVLTLEQSTQLANMFAMIEATFVGVFGILALILAASGIYGVMAYRTELRTHEIGIRVALGASRSNVLKLVLHQGMRLTAMGLFLGLTASLLLTRFLRGLLFGVSAMDPLTVLSVTMLLLLIAVAASYIPALRAMRVNPITAIREH
ncbi:MAG: ABC transporter permease [Terracidiphilus sp.]